MSTPETSWRGAALAGLITTHGVGSGGTLRVTGERLAIDSKVGSFTFTPQEVVCVQRAGFFPWFWAGVLVRHRKASYPARIGFCPRGASSRAVLDALKSFGYPVT